MPIDPSAVTWDEPAKAAQQIDTSQVQWEDDVAKPAIKKPRSFREELGRQLGLTARAGIDITTATPLAVADFITGAKALLTGRHEKAPSKIAQELMTSELGLPEEETIPEKLAGLGTRIAGGAFDPALSGITAKFAQLAPKTVAQQTAKNLTTLELNKAGIKTLPHEGTNIGRAALGFSDEARVAADMQTKNQPVLQALLAREVHVSPKDLSDDALAAAAKVHIREGYDPIRNLPRINTTITPKGESSYRQKLVNILDKYQTIDQANKLTAKVDKLDITNLKPEHALERISQIRSDATDAFRADNHNYGRALREVADTLEEQIERNLPRGSSLLAKFRSARTELAKNYAVREMLVDPSTGIVDTGKAAKMLERGDKLTGGLLTVAKAGSPLYASATKPPIRGSGSTIGLRDLYPVGGGAVLGGGIGALVGGPVGAGVGGALGSLAVPPMRIGARHLAGSDVVQNLMARGLAKQPQMFGAPAQAVMAGMPDDLLQLFGSGQ